MNSKNNNLQQNNPYVKKSIMFVDFLPKKLIDHNFVSCATTKISSYSPIMHFNVYKTDLV